MKKTFMILIIFFLGISMPLTVYSDLFIDNQQSSPQKNEGGTMTILHYCGSFRASEFRDKLVLFHGDKIITNDPNTDVVKISRWIMRLQSSKDDGTSVKLVYFRKTLFIKDVQKNETGCSSKSQRYI